MGETFKEHTPVVVVRTLGGGDVEYYVSGERVRLLLIDERAPSDRVYEWFPRVKPWDIADLIGDSSIGSSQDARHPAIKHQVESLLEGKPALLIVKDEDSHD